MLASALQQRESATSMCAPSMMNFPPASTPSQPSRSSRSTGLKSLWWTAASHQLSALHVVVHICQCYSLGFSPLLCPKFILYVWVSTPTCPANGFIRIIFLDSTYIQCLCEFCFSLSDLHHSEIQALGSFTSWELAPLCSFLWLSNIPLCIQTTGPLSIQAV